MPHPTLLLPRQVSLSLSQQPRPATSNMTKAEFLAAVDATKEHIQSGDVFQLVLSQRFERRTFADPFEIYRWVLGMGAGGRGVRGWGAVGAVHAAAVCGGAVLLHLAWPGTQQASAPGVALAQQQHHHALTSHRACPSAGPCA